MRRLLRALAALLLLLAVGLGGYAAGYNSARGAGLTQSLAAAKPTPLASPQSLQSQFGLFWDVWQIVDSEFYDRSALDYRRLTYGAIQGMLATLGDPHTTFSSPAVAQVNSDDLRGTFYGIGVQVEMKDGRLIVVAPIEGTPGAQAGIRAGDYVVKIDDEPTAALSLMDAVAKIRGPRGSKVKLTISREGSPDPLVVEVTRDEIKPVNVRTKALKGGIGYLKLNSFTETSGDDVKAALGKLMADKPKGLVLDLRDNPGGLLLASVDVASQFLKDGVVLYEGRSGADPTAFRVKPGGVATDVPLAVLINKGSASASEIVAGSLQDNGRAILVGENSFGKDSVQNVHSLPDGSSVRVTFARWFTPKRQDIHATGLKPDLPVALSDEDVKAQRDPQLEQAVEWLLEHAAN